MLEKQIELAVCEYAKTKRFLAYKFTSPARAAVPDRLMVTPKGECFFIEFKRKGAKATPAQEREHARLRDQGCQVWVIDDVQKGKSIIDMWALGC